MNKLIAKLSRDLEINEETAAIILYLRERNRWTQEKEDFLIALAKAGKKLPNVLAGEF